MTPDEMRSLAAELSDVPPFPPAGLAWQTSTLHRILGEVLRVAADQPDSPANSPAIALLSERVKTYLEAVSRGGEALEDFHARVDPE